MNELTNPFDFDPIFGGIEKIPRSMEREQSRVAIRPMKTGESGLRS